MNSFSLFTFLACVICINAVKYDSVKRFSSINDVEFDSEKSNILPSKEECGVIQACDRVFPWLVYIPLESRKFNPDANIRCAGTLINKRYVITEKSCLQFVLSDVYIGQYDSSNNSTCSGNPVLKVKVAEKVISESYDIILLRLEKEVEYRDEIKPICLPFEEFKSLEENDEVYTSTWVLDKHSKGDRKSVVENIRAVVTNREECDEQGYKRKTKNEICLLDNGNSENNLCNTNGGSPIMRNDNGHWVLEGILTWVYMNENEDCEKQTFKITDDVLEWIIENIHE